MKPKIKGLLLGVLLSTSLYSATIEEKISGLYISYFNRAADKSGLEYWKNVSKQLGEDTAIKQLSAGFATHPKYTALYDKLNNQKFVETIYINTLGQEGDKEGINYWTNLLDNEMMSRSDMVANFVSLSLDFDKNDSKYETLSQEDLKKAQERKDLLANKVETSLYFMEVLGEESNLSEDTNPMDPVSLDDDDAYKASINILSGITSDSKTKELAKNFILDKKSIDEINKTVFHNGFLYKMIESTTTQRVWLDRNLGATEICTKPRHEFIRDEQYFENQQSCLGSYFSVVSKEDNNSLAEVSNYFSNSKIKLLELCPKKFRLPSIKELLEEDFKNIDEAYDSLKIPPAGKKDKNNRKKDIGEASYLASSTLAGKNNIKALKIENSYTLNMIEKISEKLSVRCVQIKTPVAWYLGKWSECRSIEGKTTGVQIRTVECRDANKDKVDDKYCKLEKPKNFKVCSLDSNVEPGSSTDQSCLQKGSVAVFDNNSYVDTANGVRSESDNIQASLQSLGYNVLPFTREDDIGFQAGLDEANTLLMPEPENGSYLNLDQNTKELIFNFVNNGGVLISSSDNEKITINFLNQLFNWELKESDNPAGASFDRSASTQGTVFENGPESLPKLNATDILKKTSLPVGALSLYEKNNQTVVFSKEVGQGKVIFLGFDWYDAKPIGAQDGGWNEVLERSPDSFSTFTSPSEISVNENQTAVVTVTTNKTCQVSYSIDGEDASFLNIDSSTGVLTFKTAPQYETKSLYRIKVHATDVSGNSILQNMLINIINIDDEISHDGHTYGIVTSPITGKKWLDKNLGADEVCSKSREDFASARAYALEQGNCFGDLYQWGRATDGHEKVTSSSVAYSDDYTVQEDGFIKARGEGADKFIRSGVAQDGDWTNKDSKGSRRNTFWSKTDGTSICPVGFRVPTIDELKAETINWDDPSMAEDESIGKVRVINRDTAFKNFLKFPVPGIRLLDGSFLDEGESVGGVWSSSPEESNARAIFFNDSNAYENRNNARADGLSIRCIQDMNMNPIANAGEDKTIDEGEEISFDGSLSSDSDGNIVSYRWLDENDQILSSNISFSISNLTVGTHIITLIVTDDKGLKDSDDIKVEVLAASNTVEHDGHIYGIVTSPITGKQWLDKNLGADDVCSKSREEFPDDDAYVLDQGNCFGDLYQWGRATDGHEKRTSSSVAYSDDYTIQEDGFIKARGEGAHKFIKSNLNHNWDWTNKDSSGLRISFWRRIDGTSICPNGFRVPKINELEAETTRWSDPSMAEDESIGKVKVINRDTAFKNFLKFPAAGYREPTGYFGLQGEFGFVQSSSSYSGYRSKFLSFGSSGLEETTTIRANAFPVRCLKD